MIFDTNFDRLYEKGKEQRTKRTGGSGLSGGPLAASHVVSAKPSPGAVDAPRRCSVGPEAKERDLLRLLETHNDVQRAVAEFFDGTRDHAAPPTAVARPADPELCQVVTPQGMRPGQQLQVHTPSGMMRVTIPEGTAEGQVFLVRCPPQADQAGAGYPGLQH